MNDLYSQGKRVLAFLEHHRLEPSTENYDFGFRLLSDPASGLSRDVEEWTYGGLRLTQSAVTEIGQRHLPTNGGAAIGNRESEIARHAEELSTLALEAYEVTSELGRDVGSIASQIQESPEDVGILVARLSSAERDLADLRNEVSALRESIATPKGQASNPDRDEMTNALSQIGATQVFDPIIESGRPYVMMMFIIDKLDSINSKFGISVGDNVLNAFASNLRSIFPEEQLIRWTGNEYIIATSRLTAKAASLLVDEALAALGARRLKLRGTGEWIGVVTASVGLVVSQNEPPDIVLRRARANALAASALGGNQVRE